MSFCLVVANLFHDEDRPPSLAFEYIESSDSRQDHEFTSTVKLYKLQDGRLEANVNSPTHVKHCKAMAKARVASAILTQLINSHASVGAHVKESKALPTTSTGETLVIVDEAFLGCEAVDTHPWNLFFSTKFTFPNMNIDGSEHRFISAQHLQISSPTLKLDDQLLQQRDGSAFDGIEIITGVCIFNDHILKTSCSNSKLDASYLARAPTTIHELEFIARCSSTIADVAAMFILRGRMEQAPTVTIKLDVPSFHYHPSAVRAYEQGHCSAAEALQWMKAVDQRNRQISYVFIRALQYELRRRGVDPSKYKLYTSDRVNPFATAMRQSMQTGRPLQMENILQRLKVQGDYLWEEFYALIPERELPQDLEGLAYLFYVFAAVRSALVKDSRDYQTTWTGLKRQKRHRKVITKSRLILSVDDPVERRIYSRAQEVLRKLRAVRTDLPSPLLVETYMCRRAFVNGNKTRARFYRSETTPEPITLVQDPNIASNQINSNQWVEPVDVVGELYGHEVACNLQTWLMDVALPLR